MSMSPHTLSSQDLLAFLNYLKSCHNTTRQRQICIRNYCMACLMVEAGLRVGEVVKLRIEHLWFSSKPVITLVVSESIAKNHVLRSIPVSERLTFAILDIAESYWGVPDQTGYEYAFSGGNGTEPLTSRQVERIFSKAGLKSIGRPVNPHMLRHTFATRLMKVTDMRTVQMLLGHSNLSSTQVYTHPDADGMRQAIDAVSFQPRS